MPQVTVGPNKCVGDNIVLSVNTDPNATTLWTKPDNTTFTGDTLVLSNATFADMGNYTVRKTYQLNGCTEVKETSFSLSNCMGLPVNMYNFKVQTSGCDVNFSWNTGEESLIANYLIETSTDGKTFATAANVSPKGPNSLYSVTLKNLEGKEVFLRVRVKNVNDADTFSPVLLATLNCGTSAKAIAYPNPTSGRVVLQNVQSGQSVKIYSSVGQLVKTLTTTSNNQTVDISNLSSGMYIFVIDNKTNIKVIKK